MQTRVGAGVGVCDGGYSGRSLTSLSDLRLLLHDRWLGVANDQPVSSWVDKSGLGRNAMQAPTARHPKRALSGTGVGSLVDFDGADDSLQLADSAFLNGLQGRSWCAAFVIQPSAAGSGYRAFFTKNPDGDINTPFYFLLTPAGGPARYRDFRDLSGAVAAPTDAPSLVLYSHDQVAITETTSVINRLGTEVYTLAAAGIHEVWDDSTINSVASIGATCLNTVNFAGGIGMVLIRGNTTWEADPAGMALVISDFRKYWGVPE